MATAFRVGAIVLGAIATLFSDVQAAPPVSGENLGSPTKRVFVPNSGYTRSTRAAHFRRRAAERGRANFAPGQPLDVRGARSIPVICVEFTEDGTDVPPPFLVDAYQDLLFGASNPASLTAYYRDISLGKLAVGGRVVGWYKAPENDEYYENGDNGNGPPFGELLKFALEKADQDLDFGQFDNDGPDGLPNSGDDDGKVDTVFFIHPEHGAECDRGPNIWSHSWHYSEPSYGNGGVPFRTNDVRLGPDGHPLLGPGGVPQRILVEDYTIQPALACPSGGPAEIVQIGVFCHEYGHALGLPDLYDRTPNPQADSRGIGNWCLMAGGSYGGDGGNPQRPTHMSAWCKYYLGWADLQTLTGTTEAEIQPASVANEILRVVVPDTNGLEYFLVEYRRSGPGAGSAVNWDQFLRADGLLVWHVDERVGSASSAWPFAGFDAGQNDGPARVLAVPPPLFKTRHPLVRLIQSDGLMHLESNQNSGDPTDPFNSSTTFDDDPSGKKGSRGYDGKPTGVSIKNINVQPNLLAATVTAASAGANSSPILAGAPPFAPPAPALAGDVKTGLQRVQERLRPAGIDAFGQLPRRNTEVPAIKLDAADRKLVAGTPPQAAQEVLAPDALRTYRRLSAQLRTRELAGDFAPANALETAAKNFAETSASSAAPVLRLSADGRRVSQLTGLRIEAAGATPADDARMRVHSDERFRAAFGTNDNFTPLTNNPEDRTQVFRQNVSVGDAKLPVFGADVKLFYDEAKRLTAAASNVVSIAGEVQGAASTLTDEQALDAASVAVGMPKESFAGVRKGVLAVPAADGRRTGRVAFEVMLPMGEQQAPLSVYVDAATKKVLEIR